MLFGIVAAAGAALLHFVGEGLDSAGEASGSEMRQRISRLGESLRVIRSVVPEDAAPAPWAARVEAVNAGDADIVIAGIHYLHAGAVTSVPGCSTMQRVDGAGDAVRCVLAAGRLADMRFALPQGVEADGDGVGVLVVTQSGNAIWLVGGP